MREACFMADVAVLPRWIRISQLLDYVAGVHPRFDRRKAENFLAENDNQTQQPKSESCRKGWSRNSIWLWSMAMDVKLLILDEPTLGLDILYRKQFYDSL
jgi:ABC-2 type transport system ATP-binding protein